MDLSTSFAALDSITNFLIFFVLSFFSTLALVAILIYRYKVKRLLSAKELREEEINLQIHKLNTDEEENN